jgi:hypothetical protein
MFVTGTCTRKCMQIVSGVSGSRHRVIEDMKAPKEVGQ